MPRKSPLGIDGTSLSFLDPDGAGRKTVAMVKAKDERGVYQGRRFPVMSWHRDGSPVVPPEAITWAKETRKDFMKGTATAGRVSLKDYLDEVANDLEADDASGPWVARCRSLRTALVEAGLDNIKSPGFAPGIKLWLGKATVNWAYPKDYKFRKLSDTPLNKKTKNKLLGFIRRAVELALTRRVIAYNPLGEVKPFSIKKGDEELKPLFTLPELRRLVSDDARDHAATALIDLQREIDARTPGAGTRSQAIRDIAAERDCHWTTIHNILKREPVADPWWLACCVLVYTGARVQEAMHLRWENVSWDTGYIYLKKYDDFKPKTGERMIEMEPELRDLLSPIAKTSGWIIADDRVRRGGSGKESKDGVVMRDYQEYFSNYCQRVGVPVGDRTTHSLRHQYATIKMADKTRNPNRLQMTMGHSSIATTLGYTKASQQWQTTVDGWPDDTLWLRRTLPGKAKAKAIN